MIHAHAHAHGRSAYRAVPASPRLRPRVEDLDWTAAGWAGLTAGVAFLLLQTFLTTLTGGDGGGGDAVRQIAAIALGSDTVPPSTPFTALVCIAALSVHLPLSLIYARLLAFGIRGLSPARAAGVGVLFGALLYAVNYYAFTIVFPWFAAARGIVSLTSHLVYGAIAGGVYAQLTGGRRAR